MNTYQAQIKINLPLQLKEFVESKAAKYGVPLAAYVKHLMMKDVADMEFPIYKASKQVETAYKKAVNEYKRKRTIRVKDIEKFFAKL